MDLTIPMYYCRFAQPEISNKKINNPRLTIPVLLFFDVSNVRCYQDYVIELPVADATTLTILFLFVS